VDPFIKGTEQFIAGQLLVLQSLEIRAKTASDLSFWGTIELYHRISLHREVIERERKFLHDLEKLKEHEVRPHELNRKP
jgi:hypothetical protein